MQHCSIDLIDLMSATRGFSQTPHDARNDKVENVYKAELTSAEVFVVCTAFLCRLNLSQYEMCTE